MIRHSFLAAFAVAGVLGLAAAPAQAGGGDVLIGLGVGTLFGAAIADSHHHGHYLPPDPYDDYADEADYPEYAGYDAHVGWCAQRYRSYDPESNTFIGYDGRPHRCYSPYRP